MKTIGKKAFKQAIEGVKPEILPTDVGRCELYRTETGIYSFQIDPQGEESYWFLHG